MDNDYRIAVIEAAKLKIQRRGKPISEAELIRGTVHILKKQLGGEKNTHTSKSRFKKEVFNYIINHDDWRNSIIQLDDKKYALKSDHLESLSVQTQDKWSWKDVNRGLANQYLRSILEKMDPFKFELLTKEILKIKHSTFSWESTPKTGDKGVDVIGIRYDENDQNKKEIIYVQVKRFKGTVGRPEADKFSGVLARFAEDKNYSKVQGFFISTGKYSDSFHQQLRETSNGKINFLKSWDGEGLIDEILRLGIGVKYTVDVDFWKNI